MLADRLLITPEVAARARRRRSRRGARIDADQPRPALSGRISRSRGRPRRRFARAGAVPATVAIHDGRLLVGPGRRRPSRRSRRLRRVRPEGGSTEPGGRARGRRLGGDDGLGHDDRRARGRHPVFATGGIGGVHRGALGVPAPRVRAPHRPSTSRRTSRSWAARRWPSCAPARRPSSTCRPPSSTSRPGACRSSRSARRSCPGSTLARRASRRRHPSRTSRPRRELVATHLGARARRIGILRLRARCRRSAALPE